MGPYAGERGVCAVHGVTLSKVFGCALCHRPPEPVRSSLAPSPDYASERATEVEICSCDEALALRARAATLEAVLSKVLRAVKDPYLGSLAGMVLIEVYLEQAGLDVTADAPRRRMNWARAWHRVARLKHRLLHERDSVGPGSRGVP